MAARDVDLMLMLIPFGKIAVKLCTLMLVTLLGMTTLISLAHAESGSSQAGMMLIVPPHEVEFQEAQPNSASSPQPFYNHETQQQVTQQIGGNTHHQIWATL